MGAGPISLNLTMYSCLTKTVTVNDATVKEYVYTGQTQQIVYDFSQDFTSSNTTHCPIVNYTLTKSNLNDSIDATDAAFFTINTTHLAISSSYVGTANISVRA